MEIKFKYELIIDGEVVTRLFANSREELKKIMGIMKPWEDKHLLNLKKYRGLHYDI